MNTNRSTKNISKWSSSIQNVNPTRQPKKPKKSQKSQQNRKQKQSKPSKPQAQSTKIPEKEVIYTSAYNMIFLRLMTQMDHCVFCLILLYGLLRHFTSLRINHVVFNFAELHKSIYHADTDINLIHFTNMLTNMTCIFYVL